METVERITHFGEFCFVFVMNDMFVPLVKNAIKVVFVWLFLIGKEHFLG